MIHHLEADLFESRADVIAHQVNCMGVMGSGVAAQVRERFPEVYVRYRTACRNMRPDKLLGMAQYIPTFMPDRPFIVVNLFAQMNYGRDRPHTDYDALRESLREMKTLMRYHNHHSVAIPYKMGCVRGGGDWDKVLSIIKDELSDCEVFICRKDMG